MTLQTGNPDVRFRPHVLEGVELHRDVEPEVLHLDGQQRMTSLFLAMKYAELHARRRCGKQGIFGAAQVTFGPRHEARPGRHWAVGGLASSGLRKLGRSMATTLDPIAPVPVALNGSAAALATSNDAVGAHSGTRRQDSSPEQPATTLTPRSRRVLAIGLTGVRLAIGFEFLWAFLDKTFGLRYSTPSGRAWIHGGSPTTGFLSGVNSGPLQGTFHWLAGVTAVDWAFMLGLLGVGVALVVGVALRPAAIAGCTMLAMMYLATWPFAKFAGGQATGSTNPIVDDHIVSLVALVVIGALASWSIGPVSRRWSELGFVKSHSWMR